MPFASGAQKGGKPPQAPTVPSMIVVDSTGKQAGRFAAPNIGFDSALVAVNVNGAATLVTTWPIRQPPTESGLYLGGVMWARDPLGGSLFFPPSDANNLWLCFGGASQSGGASNGAGCNAIPRRRRLGERRAIRNNAVGKSWADQTPARKAAPLLA